MYMQMYANIYFSHKIGAYMLFISAYADIIGALLKVGPARTRAGPARTRNIISDQAVLWHIDTVHVYEIVTIY